MIGAASLAVIFVRLRNDLTPDRLSVIGDSLAFPASVAALLLVILLIPVNWGIEARKWQLITAPVERISFVTATKSVYSGVCLGNLAPARATEFFARILFFHASNRAKVAALHFLGGMFQLSVTILAGLSGLVFYMPNAGLPGDNTLYLVATLGVLFLAAFCFLVFRIDQLVIYLGKKTNISKAPGRFHYPMKRKLIMQLIIYSVCRYAVFYGQFVLLIYILVPSGLNAEILAGIALYFLVTTFIPMLSILEAAVRAAVALVIFKGQSVSDSALALSSVLLWLVNIMVPTLAGLYFLVRQNFNFKLFRASR